MLGFSKPTEEVNRIRPKKVSPECFCKRNENVAYNINIDKEQVDIWKCKIYVCEKKFLLTRS